MSDAKLFSAVSFVLMLSALPARAAEPELSERAVVEAAIAKNPTLRAAVVDVKRSAAAVDAEAARYRPTLVVDVSGGSETTPSLGVSGGTTESAQSLVTAGASVKQTFSLGTSVEVRVEGRHTTTEGPISGTTEFVTLGPGEGLSAKLAITQPLLRGLGQEVGLAELRQRMLARKEQERARDATASETLSAVLGAYWELWYAEKALAIEESARFLAERQREEAAKKVAQGGLAKVDLLTYDTRLAERDQSVLAAKVTVEKSTIELLRAMGEREVRGAVDVSGAEPVPAVVGDASAALSRAEEASYAVVASRIALETAQDSLRTAAEPSRPRLDLSAWVSASGLGNQAVSPALEQLVRLDAVSGSVGLVLELPVSSARRDAERAAAELAVEAARSRLVAAGERARADAATELATLDRAAKTIALAERTAEASRVSMAAQEERYRNGAATGIEVREAEDTLRRAELAVERARVDAMTAEVRLQHLTADLLARWGVTAKL